MIFFSNFSRKFWNFVEDGDKNDEEEEEDDKDLKI